MRATRCRARPAKGARRSGGQALEGVEGGCGKARGMGGLGMLAPKDRGRGRKEGMQGAQGRCGEAADPGLDGMMPVLEDALGHSGRGGRRGGRQAHGPPTTGCAPDQR